MYIRTKNGDVFYANYVKFGNSNQIELYKEGKMYKTVTLEDVIDIQPNHPYA